MSKSRKYLVAKHRRGQGALDIRGQIFGRLTALEPAGRRQRSVLWSCICSCGKEKLATAAALRRGATQSCGCLALEVSSRVHLKHGRVGSRVYRAWHSMKQRCNNPKHRAYKNYGGRGIAVSCRWAKFSNFFADMGEPKLGQSLERKDNDKGYTKSNCVWASEYSQKRNTRRNVYVTFQGKTKVVADWARELRLPYNTIRNRLLRGKTAEQALCGGVVQ